MRKAYVVAVWLIGFIMVLAGTGFCINMQGELSKLQNARQQKLLKLQSAEKTKQNAHIQSIRQQISSKKLSQNYLCLKGGAVIKSVFPTEVFPGDPILIEGCGFQANQGMVLLTEYGANLHITSWSDMAIEAVMPDDSVLNGFADPKNITIKVSTVKGSVVGSQSILLRPNFEVKTYDNIPITLGGVTPQCPGTQSNSAAMHVANIGNVVCNGTDIYAVNTSPLKNNWVFKEGELKTSCFTRHWFTMEILTEIPCPEGLGYIQSSSAQHLNTIIGSKTFPFPNITVDWKCDGGEGGVVGIYHNLNLIITGPKGTSPF